MSDTAALNCDRIAPRKRNAEATRAAILKAARAQFARTGYDLTSLRDIAGEAGVDMALIKRYFGGKEALFTEALRASFRPDFLQGADRRTFSHEIAALMAGPARADEERSHTFEFLLRAAASPTTAPLLNVVVQERFLATIRNWLGGEKAPARARVLAAVYIGLLVERLIRDEPLQGQERADFIDRAASVLEAMISDASPPPAHDA